MNHSRIRVNFKIYFKSLILYTINETYHEVKKNTQKWIRNLKKVNNFSKRIKF